MFNCADGAALKSSGATSGVGGQLSFFNKEAAEAVQDPLHTIKTEFDP